MITGGNVVLPSPFLRIGIRLSIKKNMKKKIVLKYVKAKKYFNVKLRQYEFPFEVLDKTPGGSNLGRIEWCVEPIKSARKRNGYYHIEKIYLWTKQTRDKRYAGKTFEIPCYGESITGNFMEGVWKVAFCDVHKTLILDAYPKDNKFNKLIIETNSSILIDINFK